MSARNQAFNNVLEYLEYRIAVCRTGLEDWVAKYGEGVLGAATERSALFEAELIARDISQLAKLPRRSREYKKLASDRAEYLASRGAAVRACDQTGGGDHRG